MENFHSSSSGNITDKHFGTECKRQIETGEEHYVTKGLTGRNLRKIIIKLSLERPWRPIGVFSVRYDYCPNVKK
jgi:hypothetical protein